MRIYCIATDCPKKSADYAHCTGLMSINDCPKYKKRKKKEAAECNEKNSQGDSNVSV